MMKRAMLAGLAFVTLSAGTGFCAPDRFGKFDLGVNAGGAFNESAVKDDGWVGASMSYGVLNWLAVGVEGGWQDADTTVSAEELGVAVVMVDVILRMPVEDWWVTPYGVVGLGVMGAYVTDEDGAAPNNNGDDVDDTAFAMKYGLGLDFWFQDVWCLNFEAAYYDSDPDLPRSSVEGKDVEFWTAGGGIKLFLN